MSQRVTTYLENLLSSAIEKSAAQAGDIALEIGSNDGSFLDLLRSHGFRPVGFEPSSDLCRLARDRSLEVMQEYFGAGTAKKFVERFGPANLLITRHTLEHAFDPIDFLQGIEVALSPKGLAVIEVPYLRLQMINNQFQSMTFQHVSFFTAVSLARALRNSGLDLIDISFVDMDGGSLVAYVSKSERRPAERLLEPILQFERVMQLDSPEGYSVFFTRVDRLREHARIHMEFLVETGLRVRAYGAGSKGHALLNMLGLDATHLAFVIDDVPHNLGRYVPGTGTQVISSADPRTMDSDVILITAPTHIDEIIRKERPRLGARTRFLATTPDFHYLTQ
jgi:SAM-dependent methyltransferase